MDGEQRSEAIAQITDRHGVLATASFCLNCDFKMIEMINMM
jgi:hypothetical protein